MDAVRFEIAKLDVKAGDVVVIRTDAFRSSDHIRFFRDDIARQFPDLRFMVLPKTMELAVLAPEAIDGTDG